MSSERQLFEPESRWFGEHIHRYFEAAKYIHSNDTILDIACGSGFGTSILSDITTGNVIGGDIDEPTINHCKSSWIKSNISFQNLDASDLPFSDNSFDAIISFETIEHSIKYQVMFDEFLRTLKPGGYLILSTPNADLTSPFGIIQNPFHTQEFTLAELHKILENRFTDTVIYGQRYARYDQKRLKNNFERLFEFFLLSSGISKIPYSIRNQLMKILFGHSLYPNNNDFVLENNDHIIKKYCPVLFAVCKK